MKSGLNKESPRSLRRVATALLASATAAASLAHAWPFSDHPFVVPPTNLPEPARQAGEAMLLHDAADGRTLLYIEQDQGTRLAVFDVTNPAHVKSDGSVQLEVPGVFDFVANLGTRMEVVRFRQGQTEAVLDLNRANVPTLETIQQMALQGFTTSPNANAIAEGSQIGASGELRPTFQAAATPSPGEFMGALDASQIRQQVTKSDTGTTFVLTANGLYVIRRPAAERDKERREWERHLMYDGG